MVYLLSTVEELYSVKEKFGTKPIGTSRYFEGADGVGGIPGK